MPDEEKELISSSPVIDFPGGISIFCLVAEFAGFLLIPDNDQIYYSIREAIGVKAFQQLESLTRNLTHIPFKNSKGKRILRGTEDVETIDFLVEKGLQIESMDKESGLTGFHACCAGGCYQAAWIYLERGEDLEKTDSRNWTPLHYASFFGHLEVVHMLCESHVSVNAVDVKGYNPLQLAASKDYPDVVQELLKNNSDVVTIQNFRDREDVRGRAKSRCAIELACSRNLPDVLRQFVATNLVIGDSLVPFKEEPRRRTPLMTAVRYGARSCVELLLRAKADPHVVLCKRTSLSIACTYNHLEILRLLLHYGGPSPHEFQLEIPRCSVESIKVLMEKGTLADIPRSRLVRYACKERRFDIAWMLMKNPNISSQTELESLELSKHSQKLSYFIHLIHRDFPHEFIHLVQGNIPFIDPHQIWFAIAEFGPLELLKSMCTKNLVDVDVVDRHGNCALHFAASSKNQDAIRFLLQSGANPFIRNLSGEVAQDMCGNAPLINSVFSKNMELRKSTGRSYSTTITLDPGNLGIHFRKDTIMFINPGSQAKAKGIKEGWKILKINGLPFSYNTLKTLADGKLPYDITFIVTPW